MYNRSKYSASKSSIGIFKKLPSKNSNEEIPILSSFESSFIALRPLLDINGSPYLTLSFTGKLTLNDLSPGLSVWKTIAWSSTLIWMFEVKYFCCKPSKESINPTLYSRILVASAAWIWLLLSTSAVLNLHVSQGNGSITGNGSKPTEYWSTLAAS